MYTDICVLRDGFKLFLKQFGDAVIQNVFCYCRICDQYVSSFFSFTHNGTIILNTENAPAANTTLQCVITDH